MLPDIRAGLGGGRQNVVILIRMLILLDLGKC